LGAPSWITIERKSGSDDICTHVQHSPWGDRNPLRSTKLREFERLAVLVLAERSWHAALTLQARQASKLGRGR